MTDKWRFTPEMFQLRLQSGFQIDPGVFDQAANQAQMQLDKWLSKAQTVYGRGIDEEFSWSNKCHTANDYKRDTHKALLIKIERIKKCEHKLEDIEILTFDKHPYAARCKCGQLLKPVKFEEVKE